MDVRDAQRLDLLDNYAGEVGDKSCDRDMQISSNTMHIEHRLTVYKATTPQPSL
ncbi:MAG: hypothetical protein ACFB14_20940 [Leptolyngbyaceae cyanobacterium]